MVDAFHSSYYQLSLPIQCHSLNTCPVFQQVKISLIIHNNWTSTECFHMTSRRPYWCPKTMKRRPCWCPKPVLWELNSFLMQTLSFVPINLHRCWPREWKHSIGNSLSLSQMSNASCSLVNAITQAKEIPAPILTQFPFSIFSNVFLARVARVSVGFRSKRRGTRVTQCYCFLEFQTRAPKNSGTLYPRLSRLLLKDLFVRIIS